MHQEEPAELSMSCCQKAFTGIHKFAKKIEPKVDPHLVRSQSLFYFEPRENFTVKLARLPPPPIPF